MKRSRRKWLWLALLCGSMAAATLLRLLPRERLLMSRSTRIGTPEHPLEASAKLYDYSWLSNRELLCLFLDDIASRQNEYRAVRLDAVTGIRIPISKAVPAD